MCYDNVGVDVMRSDDPQSSVGGSRRERRYGRRPGLAALITGMSGALACASTTNYVRLPDGTWGVSIGCGNVLECREYATDACPNGYEVLQPPPNARAPDTPSSLFVRCTKSGDAK